MIRLPAIIRTRVARRLFLLFVLSAFLPLALIGVISLTQARTLLLQQGDQRLAATAKAFGMGVFERLTLAAEVVGGERVDALVASPVARRMYRGIALVDEAGAATAVAGEPVIPEFAPAARARLAEGKPVAFVRPGSPSATVTIAVPARGRPAAIVVGELRTRYLWGPSDELPTSTEFCVVEDQTRAVLHCHAPGGEGSLRAFATQVADVSETASWERDGQAHRARAWAQFMAAAFGARDWIVVASQPEYLHLARLMDFRRIYIPVVVLTLLLVTWFTIRQSRNIVDPVDRLAERARGVANNEFSERLDLQRDDEFGELATAFDQMSERLGRQFASLNALAEIDGLILSTQDTTQVIRSVLQRLGEVVRADLITLTLFERESREHARTYYMQAGDAGGFMMDRNRVAAGEQADIERDPAGRWAKLAPGDVAPSHLAVMRDRGMTSAFVQPILWRGTACGTIVLGYREGSISSEEEKQRARELADRVAVAVSSAWRDEQLYQQAHYDPLTGAPNRLLFRDRLGIEIVRSQREGHQFALLFIDLDHFKNVNDSFGHSTGDLVLRETAARIGQCIRTSDTVARLGGDEFTVLLTNLHHPQEAWLIAEGIVAALSKEFALGEQKCFLSASIGIASYPADGASAEELLKSADTAMYRAKANGRSQVVFFEERMNVEAVVRLTLDRDLRVAIDRGELALHYQPQLDLRTGLIRGAEALVRWNHPTRGLISPAHFIPLAEESGFIEQLGQWTFEQACLQLRQWRDEGLLLDHVAVNVSPRQFRRHNLIDFIARCVRDAGLPPSCLEIEITEGLLLDRGEVVEGMLRALADAGHRIALDDFGTGFSSMSYLKRLPVSTIKIDKVFIEGLEPGGDSEAIVAAIVAMSHALGKVVIAEGVETGDQAAVLRRLQCDEIQGFLVSPAVPAAELAALLRAREMPRNAQAAPA